VNLKLALSDPDEIERVKREPIEEKPGETESSRRLMDDTAQRIYADYQQKAEWVMHSQEDWLKGAGLFIVVVDLLLFLLLFLLLRQTTVYIVWCLVAAVVGCGIAAAYYQGKKQYLALTAERNPGFAEFYQVWRKNRKLRRRDLADAGEMGVIVRRVAASAVGPVSMRTKRAPDGQRRRDQEEEVPRPDGGQDARGECPKCGAPAGAGQGRCAACGQALCPSCGAAVAEDDTLCNSCGIGFSLVCPRCGRELDSNMEVCPECGLDVSGRCPGCGKPVDGNQARCSACGQVLCPECGAAVGESDAACQTCGAGLTQEGQRIVV
jgi:Double zinc ribbon